MTAKKHLQEKKPTTQQIIPFKSVQLIFEAAMRL